MSNPLPSSSAEPESEPKPEPEPEANSSLVGSELGSLVGSALVMSNPLPSSSPEPESEPEAEPEPDSASLSAPVVLMLILLTVFVMPGSAAESEDAIDAASPVVDVDDAAERSLTTAVPESA